MSHQNPSPHEKIAQLAGVVPPLLTPLADGELDTLGLERLIEYVLCADVGGLFVLGTTGEGPALSRASREAIVSESVAIVAGRVPVLAGVSDASLSDAVEAAHWAAECGADAVVATPPFYFPLEQDELVAWYRALAERSPLPLMLYNFTALAKTRITPEAAQRLMDVENIAGVKDSDGDMNVFAQFCRQAQQRPGWRVFVGPEHLLADAVRMGAHGGVAGGANLRPQLFVDFYQAAVDGRHDDVAALREQIVEMHRAVYGPVVTCGSVVRGLKHALAEEEICSAESTWDLGPKRRNPLRADSDTAMPKRDV